MSNSRPIALILLALVVPAMGAERARIQKSHYALTRPAARVDVSREDLHALTTEVARTSRSEQRYTYGAVAADAVDGRYPSILVQERLNGRISESVYLGRIGADQKQHVEKVMAERSASAQFKLGNEGYDAVRHIGLQRITAREDDRDVVALTATVLTEKGLMSVTGQCLAEQLDRFEPEFNRVIESFTVIPQLTYRPRAIDDQPDDLAQHVGRMIGGLLSLGLCRALFFRNRPAA